MFFQKNPESTHPNTRNLGVAEIHISVSQFLTDPKGVEVGLTQYTCGSLLSPAELLVMK